MHDKKVSNHNSRVTIGTNLFKRVFVIGPTEITFKSDYKALFQIEGKLTKK